MSEYFMATGDARGLDFAAGTFDLLQKYCADTRYGGYYENLEPDWRPSAGGFHAGDRKGLDTHMHLMEAFTALAGASGQEVHRRKLAEVLDLIVAHMIDPRHGCGRNQFDLAFRPIPAIAIRRTWNAEREGEAPAEPADTTSYGHNVELAWLMRRAVQESGMDLAAYLPMIRKLLDHAVAHGVDWEFGGIYRDGTHDGEALILDKEFWQNAEVLVGFLEGYDLLGEQRYLDAAQNVWTFVDRHMINHQVGEWRTLLDRKGGPIDANIGNPWKACYHTGRAMVESMGLLQRILAKKG
jgi:mannobiose 2-epimerase